MIIEDVSGDPQCSVPIQLSLLNATQTLNQELWQRVPFLLTTGPLWSSFEAHLQRSETNTVQLVCDLDMKDEQGVKAQQSIFPQEELKYRSLKEKSSLVLGTVVKSS
ncbi:hypothetical protein TNCV_666621 [Trichonephila clavipes]|uniref:Uncharacterized protein n=1 Tax=Trichonephila clavipes TaxID=2585209 RepID=A0A8X6VNC2_TRICX|nr:hypothetical protein TNCV_666621 [Trichonephila clavipes]